MAFYFSTSIAATKTFKYFFRKTFFCVHFYKSCLSFKFYFYPKLRCLTLKLEIITWYGLNHLLWGILKDLLTLTQSKRGVFYNLKNWHFKMVQKQSRTLVTQRRRYQQRRVFWTLQWNILTANPFWVEKEKCESFLKQFLIKQKFKNLFTLRYTFSY